MRHPRRFHIALDLTLAEELKRRAAARDITMASLVREFLRMAIFKEQEHERKAAEGK